ncbi:hypothetical protein GCM10029964_049610 [Kibdelosporangium lantanae]
MFGLLGGGAALAEERADYVDGDVVEADRDAPADEFLDQHHRFDEIRVPASESPRPCGCQQTVFTENAVKGPDVSVGAVRVF